MTNIDSILESRDLILSTKVHLVKAMVFPVVTYGCESWTVKGRLGNKDHEFNTRLSRNVDTKETSREMGQQLKA